jgi:chemotaxis protein MotB
VLLALALALALAAGCVTRGNHASVVEERDRFALEAKRYATRAAQLEDANQSLVAERAELMDELEDHRLQREALAERVGKLERELGEREQALAASDSERRRLQSTYVGLVQDLEAEVSAGQIQIEQLREGLRVNLSQELLFPSGSVDLDPGGVRVLEKVARQLREGPHRVEVQGHTDDRGIHGGLAQRYPTNWELAGARAARVARELVGGGVAAGRVEAVSYGEHAPVAPNDTEEGRRLNRRVEIRLHPVTSPAPEPGGAEAPADATAAP